MLIQCQFPLILLVVLVMHYVSHQPGEPLQIVSNNSHTETSELHACSYTVADLGFLERGISARLHARKKIFFPPGTPTFAYELKQVEWLAKRGTLQPSGD